MNLVTESAIVKAIKTNARFFAIREPGSVDFTFGAQTHTQATDNDTFIIAPFDCLQFPIVKIVNQVSATAFLATPMSDNEAIADASEPYISKKDYLEQAEAIIGAIQAGLLKKAILSHPITTPSDISAEHWCKILSALANKYPNATVFIFNTQETGFWLGATPELLGKYDGTVFSTMALAGTKKSGCGIEWTTKEHDEQKIVADFIVDKIKSFGATPAISATYTRNAGPVEHLCTDISCKIDHRDAQNLVDSIYPTPAVSGFPKERAIRLISSIEKHKRRYYGGYFGLLRQSGDFQFYVNLRSLTFDRKCYTIFVGGGITSDSVPENEWSEIINKASTLTSIINTSE